MAREQRRHHKTNGNSGLMSRLTQLPSLWGKFAPDDGVEPAQFLWGTHFVMAFAWCFFLGGPGG